MTPTSTARSYRAPARGARSGLGPAALGTVVGLVFVGLWVTMPSNWAFYYCFALVGLAITPILIRLIPDVEAPVQFLFVFVLQFYLSFNLAHEDRALVGGTQGLNISINLLLGMGCWAIWGFKRYVRHQQAEHPPLNRPFVVVCLVFVLGSAFSILTATTRTYTVWGLFYNLTMIAIAFTAARMCSTRKGIETLWAAGLVVIATQSVVLLAQRALDMSFDMSGEVLPNRTDDGRFGGTVGMAPANASTLLMVLLFFVEYRLLQAKRRMSLLHLGVFGVGAVCLLLTLTRACWIGFLGGSIYLFGRAVRRGQISMTRVLGFVTAAVLVVAIAWGPVRHRLDANHTGAFEERWRLNYINLEMIKAHPIVGVGLNNAYDSRSRYIPDFFTDDDWVYIAHNQFLHVTAETGLVGLVTFVAVLWVVMRGLLRSRGSPDPLIADTVTVLTVGIGSLIWGMQLDFYSGMQMYVILWFVLGAAAGVTSLAEQVAAQPRQGAAVQVRGGRS